MGGVYRFDDGRPRLGERMMFRGLRDAKGYDKIDRTKFQLVASGDCAMPRRSVEP